jgi:hypothetical protein
MADFTVAGFDEVEAMLLRRSEDVENFAPDMLEAGAKILANAQRQELQRISRGDRSIGTLAASIGTGTPKKSKSGLKYYVDVYPQGNQPHGTPSGGGKKKRGMVSNAQVGFTIENGSSEMPARPWMSVAAAKSENAVHEAMRKKWEEKQDG